MVMSSGALQCPGSEAVQGRAPRMIISRTPRPHTGPPVAALATGGPGVASPDLRDNHAMHIPDDRIDDFIKRWSYAFNETLTREEARARSYELIELYKVIGSCPPGDEAEAPPAAEGENAKEYPEAKRPPEPSGGLAGAVFRQWDLPDRIRGLNESGSVPAQLPARVENKRSREGRCSLGGFEEPLVHHETADRDKTAPAAAKPMPPPCNPAASSPRASALGGTRLSHPLPEAQGARMLCADRSNDRSCLLAHG